MNLIASILSWHSGLSSVLRWIVPVLATPHLLALAGMLITILFMPFDENPTPSDDSPRGGCGSGYYLYILGTFSTGPLLLIFGTTFLLMKCVNLPYDPSVCVGFLVGIGGSVWTIERLASLRPHGNQRDCAEPLDG